MDRLSWDKTIKMHQKIGADINDFVEDNDVKYV